MLPKVDAVMNEDGSIVSFGDCELHRGLRALTRAGRAVHLRPKVYRLLDFLLAHRDRAVSREELCRVVWPGRAVSDATIDSTVKSLRRAVGDDGDRQCVVRTLSGYGYRFVASVETRTPTAHVDGRPGVAEGDAGAAAAADPSEGSGG